MSLTRSCLYLLPLLSLLSAAATQNRHHPYTPTEVILLDCGATKGSKSLDGRLWDGDANSKFITFNSQTSSSSFTSSNQDPSVVEVPYMTARIMHSNFTYIFPLSPGPKFIRLYFYPSTYSNLDISKSFFSLKANTYTLINNFSAFLTVSAMEPQAASFIKEFIITVWDAQMLNLTFSPSPASFAFINGIEIVCMPSSLYAKGYDNPLPYVGMSNVFYLENATALETAYRLNVGGRDICAIDDTGLYRTWSQDLPYISGAATGDTPIPPPVKIKYTSQTPAYTAPELVYSTFRSMGRDPQISMNYNLTWVFPSVDSGFNYLLRFHFCEIRLEVNYTNRVVFSILINNQTAEEQADVIDWSGGNSVPVIKDYVVLVPKGSQSKQDLWLALHPAMKSKPEYADAMLNGLEIFKLNKTDGDLAGSNPEPRIEAAASVEQHPRLQKRAKNEGSASVVAVIVGVVFGILALLSLSVLFFFFVKWKRRTVMESCSEATVNSSSHLPTELCRRFTITEIKSATRNFDDQNIIGCGGFGNVYKGFIDFGSILVAIKRLNSSSKQGSLEFKTEIEMLSNLRHVHLVSLIGYCDDQGEMILVYEYMSHGTLRDHLYKTTSLPLPWKQRLEICIGAAKGLNYLHTGAKNTIIHRDVKSTNILLDGNWVAKVSDFGISKMGPTTVSQTHVSTVVKGSLGYVDPEYYRRQQLSEKSDVYSFGVVLFEVLCARPPVSTNLPKEQVSLAEWAKNCYAKGTLDQIIDPSLKGEISLISIKKFGEIATSCLHDQGIQRPKMSEVIWGLEFALQLQQSAENNTDIDYGDRVCVNLENPLLPAGAEIVGISTDDDNLFTSSGGPLLTYSLSSGERSTFKQNDVDKTKSETVFSELINPKGR